MSRIFSVLLISLYAFTAVSETTFQPYTLALITNKNMAQAKIEVKNALQKNQFVVIGEYQPAADQNRWVMTVSHPELTKAVQKEGGLTGFGSVLRVAFTKEGKNVNVSYTTPEYWCRAYFREEYSNVEGNVSKIQWSFNSAFKSFQGNTSEGFGSKKGLDADDLEDYNYMMGMPKFDDTEELAEFSSYEEALETIDNKLSNGVENLKKVYKYEVPGKKLTVYGIALSGEDGEESFLPIIDITSPKHTGFLPYEILVYDNEVHMLHGRFRIALSFPDLTMGTFTKIMSTPGNIEDLMKTLVE